MSEGVYLGYCRFPCCGTSDSQTRLSIILRVLSIALATIAAVAGFYLLASSVAPTAAVAVLISAAAVFFMLALFIGQYRSQNTDPNTNNSTQQLNISSTEERPNTDPNTNNSTQQLNNPSTEERHNNTQQISSQLNTETDSIDSNTIDPIYGVAKWRERGLEIVETVSNPPSFEWDAIDPIFNQTYRENYCLLYVPRRIRKVGFQEEFNFNVEDLYRNFSNLIRVENRISFSSIPVENISGWRLVSKNLIPNSIAKNYTSQEHILRQHQDFRMPYLCEALALCLMLRETPPSTVVNMHFRSQAAFLIERTNNQCNFSVCIASQPHFLTNEVGVDILSKRFAGNDVSTLAIRTF